MIYKGKGLAALLISVSLVLSSWVNVNASDEGEVDAQTVVAETEEIAAVDDVTEYNNPVSNPDNAEESEGFAEADTEDIVMELDLSSDGTEESEAVDVEAEEVEEEAENVEKADPEAAFEKLAAEKDLMAVINLIDSCPVYSDADISSNIITHIPIGNTVFARGVKIMDGTIIYYVEYDLADGAGLGYIQSDYLAFSDEEWIKWLDEYFSDEYSLQSEMCLTSDGYADVLQFPAGYQAALNTLKKSHPNWTFVPLKTGLDFAASVDNEMGYAKSQIQKDKKWVAASRSEIEYYMDPRNFLTESYIFQFEQLTYNKSYHTESAVQNFLNNTFMKGNLPDNTSMTYAQAFVEIGSSQGVSPIHLASRVYQEQGNGTSPLVSDSRKIDLGYSKYLGYYNYFNVKASGSDNRTIITNGLEYAMSMKWNTHYKSLSGGANTIGNGYIKTGQDTVYLQKFNVNPKANNPLYYHQYMQNIMAPASESISTKKMYAEVGSLNSPFVFKIPVFENMPGFKLNKSKVTINVGETYTLTGSVNGTAVDSGKITWATSDKSIATVQNGVITAIAPGDVTISATYDKVTYPCIVTVKYPLKEIKLNVTEDIMRRPDTVVENTSGLTESEKKANHDSLQLNVSYYPDNTTDVKTCTYSSSNTKVAKVDANGLIKAVGSGTADITVKAKANSKITATCTVEVIAPIYKIELTDPASNNELLAGQSRTLSLEYWPKDTTSDVSVTWSSSVPQAATISNGTVYGIKEGSTTIGVKLYRYSVSYKMYIKPCCLNVMNSDNTKYSEKKLSFGDKIWDYLPDTGSLNMAEGNTFIGWYTGENGTGFAITDDFVITEKALTVYPYFEPDGKGFYVAPVGDHVYTGAAIKPEVKVYDGLQYSEGNELKELELNKDYTVSYSNNKSVNKEGSKNIPTITVKGKGNYSGTEKVYFNILSKDINDPDIESDDFEVTYTGKTIKTAPTITRNGTKLVKDRDVKFTYPQTGTGAYLRTGSYPVVITGVGGYSGTRIVYETITPNINIASSAVSVSKISNQAYTGTEIEPAITLTYKKQPLIASPDGTSGDYSVRYVNNKEIGTASIVISAVSGSGFYGSRTVTFKITGTTISKAKIYGVTTKTFSSDEEDVKQQFASEIIDGQAYVMHKDRVLVPSTDGINGDYTISYKNTEKAGTATVTITGINGYTGTIKKNYKIQAYNIAGDLSENLGRISMSYHTLDNPEVEIGIESLDEIICQYVQGGAGPQITLYDTQNGERRILGSSDFKVTFGNFSNISTAELADKKRPTITVSGKGNYTGKITGICTLLKSDFDESRIAMTAGDGVYRSSKNAYKITPTLTDINGKKLKLKTDYNNTKYYYAKFPDGNNEYEVSQYKTDKIVRYIGDEVGALDMPDAGTVIRVSVTGCGRYNEQELATTYKIAKASLKSAKVKVNSKEYYNGRPVTLDPSDITSVKVGKEELICGEDFFIDGSSYQNNINKGKATVYIRALPDSNYGDSFKITFSIVSKTIAWWKNLL